MPLQVKCPNPACGRVAAIADKLVGANTHCTACGTTFHVATPPMAANLFALSTILPAAAAKQTLSGALPASVAKRPADSGSPQRIGRFEVRARLGAGAFGVVYRAYDPQLQREVALKVLHLELLNHPDRVERFQREARSAAQLRHTNIVPVFDIGQDGGQYYIAAAYIPGQTLHDALDRKPMLSDRAARIVRDLAEAVGYAHRQGVVHRDLKPANILLDENDAPQLVDFGLSARQETEPQEKANRLTRLGAVMGTPAYMAPEQARGQTGELQPSADQFSLGVILYELLCGRPPFEGPPALVIHNVINTEPATPCSLNPNVPRELERICLKAMARRPEERYTDCQALAGALRCWLEDSSTTVRAVKKESKPVRAFKKEATPVRAVGNERKMPRHWWVVGTILVGAAGILTALAIGGGGIWWMIIHKRPAKERPATPQQIAEGPRKLDEQGADPQRKLDQEAADLKLKQEEAERKRKLEQEAAAPQAAQENAMREAAEAAQRRKYRESLALASDALTKNDYQRALDVLKVQAVDLRDEDWLLLQDEANLVTDIAAIEAVRSKKGNDEKYFLEKGAERADNWRTAAARGSLRGAYLWGYALQLGSGVAKDEEKGVKWCRKAADQGFATAQNNVGVCYYKGCGVAKDEQEAVKWFRKAADQGFAQAQNNLGNCYFTGTGVTKDEQEAVKLFRKAVDQGYALAQNNLGFCYQHGHGVAKDEQEAVKWYRKAADQGLAAAQCNLASCYERGIGVAKDEQEAVKWYRKAADQGDALAQNNLGLCYHKGRGVTKDEQEAVKWYRNAADQGLAVAQYNLGFCYAKSNGVAKDEEEAVKCYRKAADQGLAVAQNNLGLCYYEGRGVTKDEQEAVRWFRKAADQGFATAQNSLGVCYRNGRGVAKDEQEAVKWYRKAADQGNADAIANLKRLGITP